MISGLQITLVLACLLAGWLVYLILRKDPLAQFDAPLGQQLLLDNKADQIASEKALEHINQRLRSSRANNSNLSLRQRVPIVRQVMEEFFAADEKNCVSHFTPVKAGNVSAEWVVAPNVDSAAIGGFCIFTAVHFSRVVQKATALLPVSYRKLAAVRFSQLIIA